eukprot:2018654-Lingulodinium_polyedra.AAC.1
MAYNSNCPIVRIVRPARRKNRGQNGRRGGPHLLPRPGMVLPWEKGGRNGRRLRTWLNAALWLSARG